MALLYFNAVAVEGITVSNMVVAPATVSAGQNITLTFDYTHGGVGVGYFAAISDQCSLRDAGTSGQDILVSEDGMNVLTTDVSGGRQVGWQAAGTYPSTNIDATIYMTVPAGYANGTYYVIVGMRDWNVWLNPTCCGSVDEQQCIAFTVGPSGPDTATYTGTPTGTSTPFFSPTSTPSQTPFFSPTASPTGTPTATITQTWTPSPTLVPTPLPPGTFPSCSAQASVINVNPSESFIYRLRAENQEASSVNNFRIRIMLPAWVTYDGNDYGAPAVMGTPGVTPYEWNLGTMAAGASITINIDVTVLAGVPLGTTVLDASVDCQDDTNPGFANTFAPGLAFVVNQPDSCWQSYGAWEDRPVEDSGSPQNNSYVHVYGLKDGTNVTLERASVVRSRPNAVADPGWPMTIDTNEFTAVIGAGQVYTFGPFPTRFHKIDSNYPVVWEYDSTLIADRSSRQMFAWSTDSEALSTKPFITSRYPYLKSTGTINHGDALSVFNPGAAAARFGVYWMDRDPTTAGNSGATPWSFVGYYTVQADSIRLVGGTSAAVDGHYVVIPYGDTTLTAAYPVIVAKGQNQNTNGNNATTDAGLVMGVSNLGRRIAAAGQTLYGVTSTFSEGLLINAVAGNSNYEVFRYTSTAAAQPGWPVGGDVGTWASVATGTANFGVSPPQRVSVTKGYYKVVNTGGGGQISVQFGGHMIGGNSAAGGGVFLPATDNSTATGVVSPGLMWGRDFTFGTSQLNTSSGNFLMIMPLTGTNVTVTGNFDTSGVSYNDMQFTQSPLPSSFRPDTAWRMMMQSDDETVRVQADQDILVTFQDRNGNNLSRSIAPPPLQVQNPQFSLNKYITPDIGGVYCVGEQITYCVDWENLNCAVASYTFNDTLQSIFTFISATGPYTYNPGPHSVSWTLTNIASGATGTVCVTIEVNGYP